MVSGGWGWDVFPNSLNNHQHSGSDTTRTTFQSGKDMDIVTLCGSSTTGSKNIYEWSAAYDQLDVGPLALEELEEPCPVLGLGVQRVSERSRSKVQDSFKEVGPKMSTYGSKQVKSYSSTHKTKPQPHPQRQSLRHGCRDPSNVEPRGQGMEFFPFLDPIMVPLAKSWFIHL